MKELNEEILSVGSGVVQLYSSDTAATKVMTAYDVDCVFDITTYKENHGFKKKMLASRI